MTTTPRSLVVGLAAWCLAFLVAYFGKVNPVHLSSAGIALLGLSMLIGLLALGYGAKRFCRSASERGAALMTYASSWFVGIYIPIMAIWANAPFYAWARAQKTKPPSDALGVRLVPTIEKMAAAHFLGVALLFTVGYFVMRRGRMTEGSSAKTGQSSIWELDRVDGAFGIVALVTGFAVAIVGPGPKLTEPIQLLGAMCGAFLLCFLFRSLRLQWLALKTQALATECGPFPKKAAALCVVALWLSLGGFWLLATFFDLSDSWGFALCVLLFLTPWFFFRKARGGFTDTASSRSNLLNHFAVRCGIWSWLGCSLMVAGWVLPGISESELAKAGTISTPFALAVVSLKPIFCISALPAVGAWIGTLVVAWALPRWASTSERVLACAQAGAAGSVTSYVSLILFALSMAVCTVPSLGAALPPHTESAQLLEWMAEGQWSSLARLYMLLLGVVATGGTVLWAVEATFESGSEWLIDRISHKRRNLRA